MATEAVIEALRRLWEVLSQSNIPAALAGGLALAAWRHPRTTHDVDVLVIADGTVLTDLQQRLERAGFRPKQARVVNLGDTDLMQFTVEPDGAFVDVPVDLLLAKSDYSREALSRSVTLGPAALGFEINVLACEDLIMFKLLGGRIIDLADAAALIRANVDEIQADRLDRLAHRLNLTSELARVRREALE